VPGHREEYIDIEVLAYDERLVLRWVAYHCTFRWSLKTTTTMLGRSVIKKSTQCPGDKAVEPPYDETTETMLNVTAIVGALLFRSIIIWKLSVILICFWLKLRAFKVTGAGRLGLQLNSYGIDFNLFIALEN